MACLLQTSFFPSSSISLPLQKSTSPFCFIIGFPILILSVCLFVFDQTVCDLQVHCLFVTFNPISSISQTCFLRPFQHLISTPLQKKYLSLIFRHRISLSLIVVVVSIHGRLSFSLISDLSLSYFLQEFSSSSKLLNTFRVHFHWTKFSLIRSSDGAHGEASCHGLE
jgi:hypothetical protein